MIFQIIILYLSFAFVDVLDKFLISKRKIRPLSYAFFTVVTGALLLVAWPWVYQALPAKFIWLNLLSGAYFGLAMYVYFKVLARGEVSRVVPFIFALVPIFDIFISTLTRHSALSVSQFAAVCLLVPGALLISYGDGKYLHRYLGLTLLSAFLFSSYNFLWQYGAQVGSTMNNLMWNRLGAAAVMALLLLIPLARKDIFTASKVKEKHHTGFLFLLKQAIGGLNFIFLSYFLTVGKVPIVDALASFRYGFLFVLALFFSFYHRHILDEQTDKHTLRLKVAALILIVMGTIILCVS